MVKILSFINDVQGNIQNSQKCINFGIKNIRSYLIDDLLVFKRVYAQINCTKITHNSERSLTWICMNDR